MTVLKNNKICAAFIFWLVPLLSHAQIYKWVDESGTTHYTQIKPAKDQVIELKLPAQPASLKTADELFQEKEENRRQQIDKENALKKASKREAEARRPKSISNGREDGSDGSRCALARDVLNGSLIHSNGKPIDDYDIKVAKRDVEKFCH